MMPRDWPGRATLRGFSEAQPQLQKVLEKGAGTENLAPLGAVTCIVQARPRRPRPAFLATPSQAGHGILFLFLLGSMLSEKQLRLLFLYSY